MKTTKKFIIFLIFILIILGINNFVYAKIGDGVTVTITANPTIETQVKTGDIITYTIIIKNASQREYFNPMVYVTMPEKTEYISISTTEMVHEPILYDNTGVGATGTKLAANSEQLYTLKVKVLATAKEEIKFPSLSYILFNSENDKEEVLKIQESEEYKKATKIEEMQALIGEKAYINIFSSENKHKIATPTIKSETYDIQGGLVTDISVKTSASDFISCITSETRNKHKNI